MGICASPDNKKPILKIELSAKNQELERQLVEQLSNLLTNKGVKVEFSPLSVNRELLYMKINYVIIVYLCKKNSYRKRIKYFNFSKWNN